MKRRLVLLVVAAAVGLAGADSAANAVDPTAISPTAIEPTLCRPLRASQ